MKIYHPNIVIIVEFSSYVAFYTIKCLIRCAACAQCPTIRQTQNPHFDYTLFMDWKSLFVKCDLNVYIVQTFNVSFWIITQHCQYTEKMRLVGNNTLEIDFISLLFFICPLSIERQTNGE